MPIPNLPHDARQTFERLAQDALLAPETLLGHLGNYAAELDAAAQRHEFLDHKLATALLQCSRQLVERTVDDGDASRHLVQAALHYFMLAEDADHDFTSLTGLDDDVDVFNAVCTHLKHQDLVISLL